MLNRRTCPHAHLTTLREIELVELKRLPPPREMHYCRCKDCGSPLVAEVIASPTGRSVHLRHMRSDEQAVNNRLAVQWSM